MGEGATAASGGGPGWLWQREVVERAPVAVAVFRRGVCAFANAEAARIRGCADGASLRGIPIEDGLPESLREEVLARVLHVERAAEAAPWFETRVLRRDGGEVDVEVAMIPVAFEGTPAVLTLVRDVSDRKQRQAVERALLELSSGFVDASSRELDGVIDDALATLGHLRDVDRAYLFARDDASDSVSNTHVHECEHCGVVWDRDDASDSVSNTHEWCAPGISAEKEALQRIPVAELPLPWAQLERGQAFFLDRLDDLPAEAAPLRGLLAAQAIRSLVLVPVRLRGRLFGFLGFDSVRRQRRFTEDDATLLRIFGDLIASATERARNEEARAALQEQLHHAQKLESVGRLAGGVAHDFNNMLAVILGNAASLLDQVEPGTLLHEALLEIEGAASRSAELTRMLLAFARRRPPAPRSVDAAAAISEAVTMLRRLVPERITISWAPPSELWPVWVDPTQLHQILVNLGVNARDAIEASGTITVRARNVHATGDALEAPAALEREHVLISVTDDGCGMTEAVSERVFEPFFTTKGVGEGTGLGLATVYGLVTQHGGSVSVETAPGEGTTFSVRLPRSSDLEVSSTDERREGPLPRGSGELVLVVEDEPALLRLMVRVLGELGYRVLFAAHAREALAIAERERAQLSLLVSDVVLPGLDGRTLASALRRRQPSLRTLFVSGYPKGRAGLLEPGHREWLIGKPFTRRQLAVKVREVLDAP